MQIRLSARCQHAAVIIRKLRREYPAARIELRFATTWELLVATMLSAQCTDKRVNIVTEQLFRKYRAVRDYAGAEQRTLEQDIRSTGFFRNKARHIIAAARMIEGTFNGAVPGTMEDLLRLPGVARKTANIVLFNAFGKQAGIAVDTHVKRLSNRLGLSSQENPVKIERDLMAVVPRNLWGRFTYWIISHGRAVCVARTPRCSVCVLRKECRYYAAQDPGRRRDDFRRSLPGPSKTKLCKGTPRLCATGRHLAMSR